MIVNRTFPLGIYFLLFYIFHSSIYAQTPEIGKDHFLWFNGGFGVSRPTDGALGLIFSYQTGRLMISQRALMTFKIMSDDIEDFGLLFGLSSKKIRSEGFASAAIGLSYITGNVSGFGDISDFGIPIEVQLFSTSSPFAGLGLYGFANINSKRSFVGILFCVQLGKLH